MPVDDQTAGLEIQHPVLDNGRSCVEIPLRSQVLTQTRVGHFHQQQKLVSPGMPFSVLAARFRQYRGVRLRKAPFTVSRLYLDGRLYAQPIRPKKPDEP